MDRVRLGRALGYGARHAAKALAQAVDAAASPAQQSARPAQKRSATVAASSTPRTAAPRKAKSAGVFGPLKQFSSVIWLQVTGTFFTVFALVIGQGAWRLHAAAPAAPASAEAQKFYLYAALCALFVYFALSSFLRARRRERRPK